MKKGNMATPSKNINDDFEVLKSGKYVRKWNTKLIMAKQIAPI